MLTGRDAQPQIVHRTALDRSLAETEAQIDLLKEQIAAGREQRDQAPEAWDTWIASAEKKVTACEDRAAQLRILIAQQRAANALAGMFAA